MSLPNDDISFTTQEGENGVECTADLTPDSLDETYNSQIGWEIEDDPDVDGTSPAPDVSNVQGDEVTLAIAIAQDSDGRGYPLNYQIQAKLAIAGRYSCSHWESIAQDEKDELRQQYFDMNYDHFPPPERSELSLTGPPEFVDETAPAYWDAGIENTVFDVRSSYSGTIVIQSNNGSGFRSPIRNEQVSTATPKSHSHHAYGRAADCHFRDENGNGTRTDEWSQIESILNLEFGQTSRVPMGKIVQKHEFFEKNV